MLIFVSPLIGIVFHDFLEGLTRTVFTSVFWPQGKDTAPAHSQGEALVQRQCYSDAIDWFTARVLETPDDWRAQLRLVELLDEHGNDSERLVEERMRLIKMEEVAQALWIQAVFDQAAHSEQAGRGERAVHLYQSILWKYPDDEAADDASRNIERLRNSGVA